MSGEPDRILDQSSGVVTTTSEELRRVTLSEVIRQILKTRSVLLPIGALALTLIVVLDPSVLKVSVLAFVVLFNLVVSVTDRVRIRRATTFSAIDLMVVVVIQTGIIFLTGGIESPLVVVYVAAGLAAGLALGLRRALWIVLAVSVVLWTMTLAGLFHVLPRTLPTFFGLEQGFITDARYAVSKAVVINFFTLGTAVIGSRINVTILKMIGAAIEARQQALEALEDRNRELVHLSGAIAHELKNPLASVQGLVQLLQRGGANAEQRFEVLNKEIARMKTTLDEFLNLSRPLGELTIQEVSSEAMQEELTALHEGLARAKHIEIVASKDKIAPIACDPRKMKQALTNLLQNAIEATPAGGRVAWISEKNGSTILLGVEDGGAGMTPELLAKAADVGVTTKPGGNGIGLAVARSIAEQHRGKLVLSNKPGGGLSAVLALPEVTR